MADPRFSRFRYPGFGDRPRGRILGYSQEQGPVRDFSTLDEFYALQNRNVPAFSGSRSGVPSAGEWASQLRGMGASLDRTGTVRPVGYNEFRAQLQGRSSPGATFGDVQRLMTPQTGSVDYGVSDAVARLGLGMTPQAAVPTPAQNRASLQEQAAGQRFLRETLNPSPVQTGSDGNRYLSSRYGTGSSGIRRPGEVGVINGRPAAETLQGIANAQGRSGLSRPGDMFQPQGDMKPGDVDRLRKAITKRTPGRTL